MADNGEEFYGVHQIPKAIEPWVNDHVMPNLSAYHHSMPNEFLADFALFVYKHRGAEIVADWPADIEHFCCMLTFDGKQRGFRVPANFTFRLIDRQHDYISEIPHNALSDARALKQAYLRQTC